MDPKAALDSAERALKRKDYYEAGEYLENYWGWRRRGGFEPRGGDKKASKLGEKLSEEWEGGESGWGEAGGVEGEGYENPRPKAYDPQAGYRFQILCRNRAYDPAWEHCDYAVDSADKKHLLENYRQAYGAGWEFQTILLPEKYWPKKAGVVPRQSWENPKKRKVKKKARKKTSVRSLVAKAIMAKNPSSIRSPDVRWSDTYLWYGPGNTADEIENITRVVGAGDDWEVTEFTFLGGYEHYEEGEREWIGQTVEVEARGARDAFSKGVARISERGGTEWEGTTEDLIYESALPPRGTTYKQWKKTLTKNPRRKKVGKFKNAGTTNPKKTRYLIDEKLYTVTWAGSRKGNLTAREAVDVVHKIRAEWKLHAPRGVPKIQVWYRDGSLVAFADLERSVLKNPKGSSGRKKRKKATKKRNPVSVRKLVNQAMK